MSASRLAAAVAAIWVFCGPAAALEPGMRPASPAAWSLRLGALKLTALRDAGYVTPNDGGDFGTKAGAQAVSQLLAAAGAPTDRITLDISALVIRGPGRVILLDTGVGAGRHGALAQSLAMAGVSADEITDVLVTHAHFDHVGGLVSADGKPAFPKAVIHISAREWAWMQTDAESKALAPLIAARVRTFEPGREVLPGITPIALYGHTPGHVGYEIVSRGQRLEDIGDMAHSTIVNLAQPGWEGGMDMDPPAGVATRRAALEHLARTHELVFSPHFPFPGVGRVAARGEGYVWAPVRRCRMGPDCPQPSNPRKGEGR